MRPAPILCILFVLGCHSRDAPYHLPPAEVTYMVDTISPERRQVLDLWRSYLSSRPHELEGRSLWSEQERRRPIFDLASGFILGTDEEYRRTRVTVFRIAPARERDSSEYVIRSVIRRPDAMLGERMVVERVYAMRENGRWVLSNALPRMTADWSRTAFGAITYLHAAEHRVDTVRARMAVRFIDSLAATFDVPRPTAITYYLATTPEEIFRINGIELYIPGSRAFALVANHMVFSGVPSIGEFYAHELTHMVLAPMLRDFRTPAPIEEALAVWLGGGRQMTWPELKRELARELRRDPSWTLEKLLEERPATFTLRLTTLAALLDLAHRRRGLAGLKAVLKTQDAGAAGVVGAVADALSMQRPEVDAAWRRILLGEG